MKIHQNPNFPRFVRDASEHPAACTCISSTNTCAEELSIKNQKELRRLHNLQTEPVAESHRAGKGQCACRPRCACLTGPPLCAPGGHVHMIRGTTCPCKKRK